MKWEVKGYVEKRNKVPFTVKVSADSESTAKTRAETHLGKKYGVKAVATSARRIDE